MSEPEKNGITLEEMLDYMRRVFNLYDSFSDVATNRAIIARLTAPAKGEITTDEMLNRFAGYEGYMCDDLFDSIVARLAEFGTLKADVARLEADNAVAFQIIKGIAEIERGGT